MIRVVADANVLISAALARNPEAPSVAVFDAAIGGRIELLLSPTLLDEITDVLSRPRLRRFLSEVEVARFVADLRALATAVSDAPQPHAKLCRDPGDDYLLALASHAGADAIVTGDRDLLDLAPQTPRVVPPRQMVLELGP